MTDPADRGGGAPGPSTRLEPGADRLGSTKSSPPALAQGGSIQRWVNEGGSLAGREGRTPLARQPGSIEGKEARDTVSGCRDRAADDRLRAAATDTENGRRAFERSAATWETRAVGIEETENASAQQRAADRALWASGEANDRTPDD